nr:MAG TPA: hypothetical protein [Caudoviricetes sp.]
MKVINLINFTLVLLRKLHFLVNSMINSCLTLHWY